MTSCKHMNARPVSDTLRETWTLCAECRFELVLFSSRNRKALPHSVHTTKVKPFPYTWVYFSYKWYTVTEEPGMSSVSEELPNWFVEKKWLSFNVFLTISHGSNSSAFFHCMVPYSQEQAYWMRWYHEIWGRSVNSHIWQVLVFDIQHMVFCGSVFNEEYPGPFWIKLQKAIQWQLISQLVLE